MNEMGNQLYYWRTYWIYYKLKVKDHACCDQSGLPHLEK
jgi:hypothetical protein